MLFQVEGNAAVRGEDRSETDSSFSDESRMPKSCTLRALIDKPAGRKRAGPEGQLRKYLHVRKKWEVNAEWKVNKQSRLPHCRTRYDSKWYHSMHQRPSAIFNSYGLTFYEINFRPRCEIWPKSGRIWLRYEEPSWMPKFRGLRIRKKNRRLKVKKIYTYK